MTFDQKVRKRASYEFWKDWFDTFLAAGTDIEDASRLCRKLHATFDGFRSYGTAIRSKHSLESLNIMLRDRGLENDQVVLHLRSESTEGLRPVPAA